MSLSLTQQFEAIPEWLRQRHWEGYRRIMQGEADVDRAQHSPQIAVAGQSIGLTLDRQVFIERGDLIAAPDWPARAARRLRARVFWLHLESLRPGDAIGVGVGTAERRGRVRVIENVIDPGGLANGVPRTPARNHIGEIKIELACPIAADVHAQNPQTSRLVLDLPAALPAAGLSFHWMAACRMLGMPAQIAMP